MKMMANVIIFLGVVLLTGCSGEGGNDGDHVWKEQTDTIDRAKQAEEMMKKKADEQRKAIEDIGQ